MTKSEFVRLSSTEQGYGQKHLLNTQLELLRLMESFHAYKELRGEELVLKVTLKNKIEETLNLIDKLERVLPKAHYRSSTPEDKQRDRKKRERKLSLQEEIDRVREKLGKLHSERL